MISGKRVIWLAKRVPVVLLLLGAGFLLGHLVSSGLQPSQTASAMQDGHAGHKSEKWYCSMHPQIIRDGPGMCPLCDMALIPMPGDLAAQGAERELAVSEAAAKLMEIQTSSVERKFVATDVRMVGKVAYDETRVKSITAWVPGRIDRLYVDFTGTRVAEGDHLVYLYSPELISAQAELLQALKATRAMQADSSDYMKTSTESTLAAVRRKLRLLGLKAEQVAMIEASGEPVTHLTIYAPLGGVVIEKKATEGMYVTTGTPIYTVADLSELWVKLDAYESDLAWIRFGQKVTFTAQAYPGEVFKGWISFIAPSLNPKTRTVKVRVNVPNADGRLKPEMFVRAVVESRIARDGKAMDPNMAGRWICPMHPSVVKAEKGLCDICEMDLVTTESLGYVAADVTGRAPLVIPASAPLITGKRAVVYVQKADTETPTFEGREVVLGPRAGEYYIVRSGLAEGERVVTRGNFKIDSALQLQAKPSMMSPPVGPESDPHRQGNPSHDHAY